MNSLLSEQSATAEVDRRVRAVEPSRLTMTLASMTTPEHRNQLHFHGQGPTEFLLRRKVYQRHQRFHHAYHLVMASLFASCTPLDTCGMNDAFAGPLHVMSCKEAATYPERIDPSDTRFVECGRAALPIGQAANLGKPIYVPERGPLPHEARRYTRDSCDDGGGAISEFSLFYDEKDLGAAISCARARCQRNDARGCEDLGRLHSDTVLPGVRKDEKTATEAFTRGCELGWGRSCLSLAHMAEARGDQDRAIEFHTAACNANPPDIFGCNRGGGALFKRAKAETAKPLLQRGCRGVMPIDNIFAARRDGCILLAAMAEQAGDLAAQREYLRLACAYGHDAIQACEELGLLLVRSGDIHVARSYLHASCESLPSGARHSSAACRALSEIKLSYWFAPSKSTPR